MKLLLLYLFPPMLWVLLLAQMHGQKLGKGGLELITLPRYLLALLLAPLP